MDNTSYIAVSRATGLFRQMETVANNLANMNTSGYKADHMMFRDFIVKAPGGESPWRERLAYVQDVAEWRDTSQGPVTMTQNPLDLALDAEGYFVVETPQGERYTRDGRFALDSTGQLVTQEGHPVLADGGQPVIFAPDETNITVAGDGTISTDNGTVAQLQVVRFENPQAMQKVGDNLLTADPGQQPELVITPRITQGAVEGSNVQPVLEINRMIETQRSYDMVNGLMDKEQKRQSNVMTVAAPLQNT